MNTIISQILSFILSIFNKKQQPVVQIQTPSVVVQTSKPQEIPIVPDIKQKEIQDYQNYPTYIKTQTIKRMIVLHGTGGGTKSGAIETMISGKLGVHFIIDQNANIVRLFPEKYYAYHAGQDFRTISKYSFGIQIVNWISLNKINDKYYTWTKKQIQKQNVIETQMWRGSRYWQKISDEQFESLRYLLKYLCQTYDIPKRMYRQYDPALYTGLDFKGIVMHSSFHPTRQDFEPSVLPKIIL